MNEMPQAISYIRVSTAMQVDGASLDTQERRCQEWALQNGVLNVRTFREEGASAKTAERPVLKEMLVYIAEHHRDLKYLLIYEVDRLSRNLNDFVEITRQLAKYGVELKDPSSSLAGGKTDKFIRNLKAVLAELDNDMKSERVTENMKRHATDGYRMAKAPYGLRNVRDLLGRSTVEPVPELADNIAYLLTEFSKGSYTIKELISMANDRGLKRPNGKAMNHMFMGKVLRQTLYAGLEKNEHTNGELVESVFPGVVSKQVYYRNQQLLERRKANKVEGYQINHSDYPLRRFIKCATCGRPIRGSASTGASGKTYPRYHCDKCKRASVSPDNLHTQFEGLLDDVKPSTLTLKLMKTMIVRVWNDELKGMHHERKKLQDRINDLEEHKQNATDKLVSDQITKQEKLSVHAKADKEILDLSAAIGKVSMQIGTKQEAIDFAFSYMDNASALWHSASPDMRLIYQAMVFPEGVSYHFYKNKFGTPKLSALYTLANMKKDLSEADKSLLVTPRRVELLLPG